MSINERLKILIKVLKLSLKEFSEKTEVPYQSLQNYLRGERTPTIENLIKLSSHLNINLNWLLTGEGEMFIDEKKSGIPETGLIDVKYNTVKLNYYPNISVSAGYGIQNEDESFSIFEVPRQFLIAIGIKVFKNLDLISVVGDSMEPFISNGEIIIVERTQEARNGDIVIANINGEVYVKKLQKDPFKRYIKLISTNPAYLDIELKDEELDCLRIIGVVRAKIRPF
jgi:phage repressor protein C with HTH and peptisase S24 domain